MVFVIKPVGDSLPPANVKPLISRDSLSFIYISLQLASKYLGICLEKRAPNLDLPRKPVEENTPVTLHFVLGFYGEKS